MVKILNRLHVLPGRVRFKADIIYKDKTLSKYISAYIDNLYGVKYSRVNTTASTILVIYDEDKSNYKLIESKIKSALLSLVKNKHIDFKNYDRYFDTIQKRDKARLKLLIFGILYISFKLKQTFLGKFTISSNLRVLQTASVITIIGGYPLLKKFYNKFTKHVPGDTDLLLKLSAISLTIIRESTKGISVLFLKYLSDYIKLSAEINCMRELDQNTRKNSGMAWLIRQDNSTILLPVESLNVGDTIYVYSGDIIPSRILIEDGSCIVNNLYYSGQPVIQKLKGGNTAYEGMTLLSGSIKAKILEIPKISLKPEAIFENTNINRKIKKYQNNVTHIALGAAAINYVFTGNLLDVLSILLVLCPAASNTALNNGMKNYFSLLHKYKIYYKNPNSLEKLINTNSIVFDKTGTLTEGIMKINDIKLYSDFYSKYEILNICAAAEMDDYHSIAITLQREAENYDISKITNYTFIPSSGIEADYNNHKILIGNIDFMKIKNINTKIAEADYLNFEENFYTPILVSIDGKLSALLILKDVIRSGSHKLLKSLKSYGLKDIYLLTGDTHKKANDTAKLLGINNVYSECTTLEKNAVIESIKKRRTVMMVGDGINDSMAMENADISVSFCNSSCDKVKLHSDCIIFDDNIENLTDFIYLSKRSYRIMKQNIIFSQFYNMTLGTLAFLGFFDPFTAKSLNTINSLLVLILNERIKAHSNK